MKRIDKKEKSECFQTRNGTSPFTTINLFLKIKYLKKSTFIVKNPLKVKLS